MTVKELKQKLADVSDDYVVYVDDCTKIHEVAVVQVQEDAAMDPTNAVVLYYGEEANEFRS